MNIQNDKMAKPKSAALQFIIVAALCMAAVLAYARLNGVKGGNGNLTVPDGASPLLSLSGNSFGQTIDTGVSVVDFWAEWCGPCRLQIPIMDKLARRFSGRAVVAKVDTDTERQLAERYGIRSIPTIVVFKDGKEITRFIGVTDEGRLASVINGLL